MPTAITPQRNVFQAVLVFLGSPALMAYKNPEYAIEITATEKLIPITTFITIEKNAPNVEKGLVGKPERPNAASSIFVILAYYRTEFLNWKYFNFKLTGEELLALLVILAQVDLLCVPNLHTPLSRPKLDIPAYISCNIRPDLSQTFCS